MTKETVRWIWYGYQDVKSGLGFRKQYEDCEEYIQRNYETGRSYAITLKREWGVVPDWPANVAMFDSKAQQEALLDKEVAAAMHAEQEYHFKNARKAA